MTRYPRAPSHEIGTTGQYLNASGATLHVSEAQHAPTSYSKALTRDTAYNLKQLLYAAGVGVL